MPLTKQESIGLGVSVLKIWDDYVDAHSLRQLDLAMRQYIDESVIAYIRKEDVDIGIRIVNLEEFKCLRKDITKII